jgi:tetratricopeptide (TPR) repeat protein
LDRAVRGELDWIVMKALEKDRRRRYETANDFAADVMRHLTDRTVEACPPSGWYRLRKFARRNRPATTMAAVVALALVAGTAVSTWQAIRAANAERRASADRSRAERRSEQARHAVDEMYTEVAEKWLKDQPALTTLQREFLEKALAFYEQLAAEEGSSPQVRSENARAWQRVGAIRQALGRHAEAEAAFRRAIALGSDLARRYPDQVDALLGLAETRIKLATLCREAGKPFEHVKTVRMDLGKFQREFASKSREGRVSEAEQAIRQASRELATLQHAVAKDAALRRRLATAYLGLCSEMTQGRLRADSEAASDAAVAIWESLVKDFPGELEDRYGLARAVAIQGMQRMWGDDQDDKAEEALRRAEALLSTLQRERPGDPGFRQALAATLGMLGVVLHSTNRPAEAEAVNRRFLALSEGLVADFPEVLAHRDNMAMALNNLAAAVEKQGRRREAEDLHRRALAFNESLVERYPDVPKYTVNVGQSSRALAEYLYSRESYQEARQVLERGLLRARALIKSHPELFTAQANLTQLLMPLPRVALLLGDQGAATRSADEWAHWVLADLTGDELGPPVSALCETQLQGSDETGLSKTKREAYVQACHLRFQSLVREAAKRAPDSSVVLVRLADALSTAPEEIRDPGLALKLAEKAVALEPGSKLALQSLGRARYRAGDWKGCTEVLNKTADPQDVGFFGAMAYWRLDDQDQGRAWFEGADRWLDGYGKSYEEQLKEGTVRYPPPSMSRRVRDEAASLLGVGGARAGTKAADESAGPRK